MGGRSAKFRFYSLLYLAQALGQINFTDDCQLTVISNNMWEIASEGWLSPEKATLMGPINVIPQEYPNISCRSIDIVLPPAPWQKAKLLDQLLKELQAESEDRVIAYRGNYRWIRTFESVPLETPQASTLPLKTGGVYLITGGMGGIGLSLAEYLAKTVQAKLILIARSDFPVRSEWEQWLLTHHEQDATSRKIQKIQEMEVLGAEVLVITADVANQEQMHKAIANSLTHFGDIHGAIHAAGVPGGGIIQLKNRSMTEEIFAPKIKGTLVLDRVLQDIKLDWLILCSSLNSVQALFGQVDYCAANAFLDAFAHYKTNQGTNTIAINWDAWQEVGMAAKAVSHTEDTSAAGSTTNGLKNLLQGNVQKWLLPSEGVDVFRRILSYGLTQVLVSTVNLETSIKQENKFSQTVAFQNDATSEKTNAGAYPRPQLSNPYVAPRNPLEEAIAQVWQQFLGIAAVGVGDRFLDLGGDSLLGTQIIAQLRERLAVKLSLASLFETPTVAEMAASLVNKIGRDKHLMKNPVLESSDREEFIL
ncbi:SDR family NAD(P)-dependent oxidoreductase [uncultured Nostoc sp.]|uniref:SDR family NAD(P)-dependent oxidoreductase n=1 Tax=uncultured Nostoc sp. TaxID=340711 RepID=UPI0035CB9148